MFDSNTGIEAFVKPFGSREHYKEYEASASSPLYNGATNERYIEAVTSERFAMGVRIHPGFDFKTHPNAEVEYDIDDGRVTIQSRIDAIDRQDDPILEDDLEYDWNLVKGTMKKTALVFAHVPISEDFSASRLGSESQQPNNGKIVITIQRGKVLKRRARDERTSIDRPPTKTSKKKAVDQGQSHALQHEVLGDYKHSAYSRVFKAAKGSDGEVVKFTFFYTSRMFLEIKKLVPIELVPQETERLSEAARMGQSPLAKLPGTLPSSDNGDKDDDEDLIMMTGPTLSKSKPKVVIDLEDCDDDEPLHHKPEKSEPAGQVTKPRIPQTLNQKRVKIEPVEEEATLATATPQPAVSDRAVKVEASLQLASPGLTNDALSTIEASMNTTRPSAKGKKLARLQLQLEEIKIKQQMMELEEQDE